MTTPITGPVYTMTGTAAEMEYVVRILGVMLGDEYVLTGTDTQTLDIPAELASPAEAALRNFKAPPSAPFGMFHGYN